MEMIEFGNYVLYGIAVVGIIAGFWVLSHLSAPGRDYSDDWRGLL